MLVTEDNFLALQGIGNTKNSTLKALSQKLFENKADIAFEKFIQREEEFSTGLVDGFAIPHAKLDFVDQVHYYFVELENEIEWDSLDGKPVDTLVVLIIPDNGTKHIKILSTISKLMMKKDFKEAIKEENIVKINQILKETI